MPRKAAASLCEYANAPVTPASGIPYAALMQRSDRADTVGNMRFLVVGISLLALIVLVIPTH